VGPVAEVTDLHVSLTRLEEMAACPFQGFVKRQLCITNPAEPLLQLPGKDPRLVGLVVHAVLQSIVDEALGKRKSSLERALRRRPTAVPWPAPDCLDALLAAQIRRHSNRAWFSRPAVDVLLGEAAKPLLETAKLLEWSGGHLPVDAVGAEVSGQLEVGPVGVRFRVDRIDADDGCVQFVDYKTGKSPWRRDKKQETRWRRLVKRIGRGQTLQTAAYVLAAPGRQASARYVYLATDEEGPDPPLEVTTQSEEAIAAFHASVSTLGLAVLAGVFPPRVETPQGVKEDLHPCRFCEVKQACHQGDSGFRRRLAEWLNQHPPAPCNSGDTLDDLAARLWWLGSNND